MTRNGESYTPITDEYLLQSMTENFLPRVIIT